MPCKASPRTALKTVIDGLTAAISADAHCPVLDIVENPVPVERDVKFA